MSRNVPEKITTKGGHKPRARIHAGWSPIGQHHRRVVWLRALGVLIAVLLVVGFAVDAYAQSFFDSLPSIRGLDSASFAGDTVITDKTGGVELADVGYQTGDHRLAVTMKEIAPTMVQATVAIEDKGFYSNPGFDAMAILRALYDNLRTGHITSGASTITQQLAKQQFLTPDQTYSRKIKELALAYELSQTYSKDQIMNLYLNKSFYGSQSYGVEAAAEGYFHIPASQLDLAQSAMLAGLPQAPTEYNPVLNPDAAKVRQTEVLQAMVNNDYISQDEMNNAVAEKLTFFSPTTNYKAPFFVDYVEQELQTLGFQPGVQQLTVKTTLDWNLQSQGEAIVRSNLKANLWRDPRGQLSSALVAEDPRTGDIEVMVGGPDYNASTNGAKINLATTPRNMGSSMKPYTYGAVIAAKVADVDTPIYDGPSPLIYKDAYSTTKFYNYDGKSHGVLPLKKAFANSLNICAVKAELSIGVPSVLDWMRNMGVDPRFVRANPDGTYSSDPNAPPDEYGPSLTLGGYPVTLLEHVTGIGVYADMGVYHSPEAILSVSDSKGNILYGTNPDDRSRLAIDPGVAYIMAQTMADDNNRALIFGYGSPLHWNDHTVAAKTGTTDNFKDAVTVAFNPTLVAGLWVGDILDINHYMVYGSDGVFVASPGLHTFVEVALKGEPGNLWYSRPPDVVPGPNNSWYLTGVTSIDRLPGDNPPSPTPKPVIVTVPPDPGTGPVLASPSPSPTPSP
jgi:membrane peptidoglycan carboxypeptidase